MSRRSTRPFQAAGFMEPPEVADGAYRVFDAEGHEAELGIERQDVVIKRWDDDPHPINCMSCCLNTSLGPHTIGKHTVICAMSLPRPSDLQSRRQRSGHIHGSA